MAHEKATTFYAVRARYEENARRSISKPGGMLNLDMCSVFICLSSALVMVARADGRYRAISSALNDGRFIALVAAVARAARKSRRSSGRKPSVGLRACRRPPEPPPHVALNCVVRHSSRREAIHIATALYVLEFVFHAFEF